MNLYDIYEVDPKEDNRGNYFILPLEFSAGMYFGIRFGFNFSEFVDFIVGLVGFDPLSDDVAGIPEPIYLEENWEDLDVIFDQKLNDAITPIISITKSKYNNKDSKVMNHCFLYNSCIQYLQNENINSEFEATCNRGNGLFKVNSKCFAKNVIGFCQFSNYEKLYLYKDGFWLIADSETDCKNLNGKFVK
ncbi:MAG TPA: hypothetical protein PK079_01535 [Leptospiraceae bacterium]|nr:hypothetical protein [Leptospiraceae bacterium]HMX35220.1 hypothetical protein [Leptospiraceae bacterium]HMY33528.1 hypothetical protein [Leptospiraceae bacterium]HMZ66115.1 hypothetical protein [Leptospiraceae bacterium]HNA09719.1 hypothetical protein [Leptospiraceae bacterium]